MVEENSFPQVLKAFIVITLFAFLVGAIVLNLAGNYDKDTTEISERIDLDRINSTLQTTEGEIEGWQETFSKSNEQKSWWKNFLDILGLLTVGVFNLFKSMMSFIITPFEIFSNILTNVIGIPKIVSNIINGLVILAIIFGIWSLVKRGV